MLFSLHTPRFLLIGLLWLGSLSLLWAQAPTDVILSNASINENEDLYTFIGTLSAIDANQVTGHRFDLVKAAESNALFRIQSDSLFSFFSFNYEKRSRYTILVRTRDNTGNILLKSLAIAVTDLTGKYDQNGIADTDIANKYPQVNVGDYIYFNGVGNVAGIYAQNNGSPSVSYPNKVLIKGDDYIAISINCTQLNGNHPNQRIAINNFLGQVYVSHYLYLEGGSHWRLTGAYDAALGLGSAFYTGCHQRNATVDFGFSHQNYGIWVSREWMDESTNLVRVSGTATGFEIDHLEISDGGFAGLMLKYDNNNVHSMDNVALHHLYIHDIGSEGMYIGSTQSGAQHAFNNLHLHHCAILRTGGEAIQIGQQSAGCLVEHNVIWGAFDWLSPFGQWQDNVFQLDARNGDITIRNNILLGAAGNAFSLFNRSKPGITPNGQPITLERNLIWCSRGGTAAYQGGPSDGMTPWVWQENYAGKFFFDYDRVYPNEVARSHILSIGIQNSAIAAAITDNKFDATRTNFYTLWGGGTVQVTASNNNQVALDDPQFRHFLDQPDALNYLQWTRWTARIGEDSGFPASNTNKGQPVDYLVGDVVQYAVEGRTRFYKCLQNHRLQEPSAAGNAFWKLLTWNKPSSDGITASYLPPDDVRLDVGSFYYQKNIGLEGASSSLVVDAGADRALWAPVTSVQLEGHAYHPNASITTYQWTQITGTALSLSGQNTATLSFNNPPTGSYSFVFSATTNGGVSASDTVLLDVVSVPQLPLANAGNDLILGVGTTTAPLDGSASFDPDGQLVAYQWNLVDAPQHPVTATFVNFTSTAHTASNPWNNTNGTTTMGSTTTSLMDANGATTTVGVELLDDWGGVNTAGMTTGNNSGVFPDAVLNASYWFQTGTHQVRVFGLTPHALYNFKFLASRDGGGNRTTIYTIGERAVQLDASYNSSNTAALSWVAADNTGEVLIEISKATGASYGYLNALVIEASNLTLQNAQSVSASLSGIDTGSYWVTLQVMDDDGGMAADTVILTVGILTATVRPSMTTILLQPNPTTGLVSLFMDSETTIPELRCLVYNTAGQVIQQQIVRGTRPVLDLSTASAGLYLITLQNSSGAVIWSSKLIKQ